MSDIILSNGVRMSAKSYANAKLAYDFLYSCKSIDDLYGHVLSYDDRRINWYKLYDIVTYCRNCADKWCEDRLRKYITAGSFLIEILVDQPFKAFPELKEINREMFNTCTVYFSYGNWRKVEPDSKILVTCRQTNYGMGYIDSVTGEKETSFTLTWTELLNLTRED